LSWPFSDLLAGNIYDKRAAALLLIVRVIPGLQVMNHTENELLEIIISSIALTVAVYTFLTKHRPYLWVYRGQGSKKVDFWGRFIIRNGGEVPAADVELKITWHTIDGFTTRIQ
jgi:hypothetical protein